MMTNSYIFFFTSSKTKEMIMDLKSSPVINGSKFAAFLNTTVTIKTYGSLTALSSALPTPLPKHGTESSQALP